MVRALGMIIGGLIVLSLLFYVAAFAVTIFLVGACIYGCIAGIKMLIRWNRGEEILPHSKREVPNSVQTGVIRGLNDPDPVAETELSRRIRKVENLQGLSPEVLRHLHNIHLYLENLNEETYKRNRRILEGMGRTLQIYCDLSEGLQTEQTQEILNKIEKSLPDYEYALAKMYDGSIADELMDAGVHIDVMEQQLHLNGYGRSDFDERTL